MQNSAESLRRPMLLHQSQTVVPRVLAAIRRAAMNNDRQLRDRRQLHLSDEHFLLHIAQGVVIEIVQSDLAPGNDFGMPRQPFHILIGGFIRKPSLVRMNAQRRINKIVSLRQLNSAVYLLRTITVADGNDGLHSGLACPRDDLLAVGVELLAIKVRVRIDKHRTHVGTAASAVRPEPALSEAVGAKLGRAYFNLAPTGTSSRNPASTGFPSSSDAATIIPFDSSPRIFRGARFATITTFRPTNASGAYASAIPASTCRTSVPISISSRKSLSDFGTRSATLTSPTRNSTLAKSSIAILPSVVAADAAVLVGFAGE